MHTARDCTKKLEALYGNATRMDPAERQVLHVAAVWRDPNGPLRVLRIADNTPRSATDRFVLGAARARADAILTTGRILREEPGLTHLFADDPDEEAALRAWRREAQGKSKAPRSVVLTRGQHLDFEDPLLHSAGAVLLAPAEERSSIESRARQAGCEIETRALPTRAQHGTALLGAIASLGEDPQLRCIAVECGPSTSKALYEGSSPLTELLLSIYEEAELPEEIAGEAFASREQLEGIFGTACLEGGRLRQEESGAWRFLRLSVES